MKQFGSTGLIHADGSVSVGGLRASSKGHRTTQVEPPGHNTTSIEARITSLFMPWLIEDIPDETWQTLQNSLGCIIKEMGSTRGNSS